MYSCILKLSFEIHIFALVGLSDICENKSKQRKFFTIEPLGLFYSPFIRRKNVFSVDIVGRFSCSVGP